MITKIWFHRTTPGNAPGITLFVTNQDGTTGVLSFDVSEEVYDTWVPDTNHIPGENLNEGIIWEKPLVPDLKTR
jgi:hypothetical protein